MNRLQEALRLLAVEPLEGESEADAAARVLLGYRPEVRDWLVFRRLVDLAFALLNGTQSRAMVIGELAVLVAAQTSDADSDQATIAVVVSRPIPVGESLSWSARAKVWEPGQPPKQAAGGWTSRPSSLLGIAGSIVRMVHGRSAVADILDERERQRGLGYVDGQDHPDGTGNLRPQGASEWLAAAAVLREACDRAFKTGRGTWAHILLEEVAEVMDESDPQRLRAELVQVGAVVARWVDAIDRRGVL